MTPRGRVNPRQGFDRAVCARAPYPLATAWSHVVAASGDAERLGALGAFTEVLVRFTNALVLPDYLRGAPVADVEKRIARLSRPSLGVLCGLYRTTCEALHARGDVFWDEPVVAGRGSAAPAVRALDRLVELRNLAVHHHPSTAQRALLASDFVAAARAAFVAMPWLFRARLVRAAASTITNDGATRGRLLSYFGGDGVPAGVEATWSAPLVPHVVYLAHPEGDRLLALEPFVGVADVDAQSRDRLHLWKNVRDLAEVSLVEDGFGHVVRHRPLHGGVAVAFTVWAARRAERPSPLLGETLAVAVLRAPSVDDAWTVDVADDSATADSAAAGLDPATAAGTTEPTSPHSPTTASKPSWSATKRRGVVAFAFVAAVVVLGVTARVQLARCGDGVVDANEDCDDGNDVDGDACGATCRSSVATLPAAPMWLGFRDDEIAAGMPLVSPSRRPAEYLLARAAYAQPATPVLQQTFRIMKTEVSRAAFAVFLRDDGDGALARSGRTPEARAWHSDLIHRIRARHHDDAALSAPTHPLLPVEIPLEEAVAFCAWLGGALPSESQFEYAAKGPGAGRIFPWGSRPPRRSPDDCDLLTAHFMTSMDPPEEMNCGGRRPTPVGSKPAGCTPEGICDLSGNVDEWVHPGPVHWVLEEDPNDTSAQKWIARLPGPRATDAGSFDVAMPCDYAASDDPYGLRTGVVTDCYHPGTRPETPATHPTREVLGVVRGGNFDDSLPVFYQSRGRYPYYPLTYPKGFRCVFGVDE